MDARCFNVWRANERGGFTLDTRGARRAESAAHARASDWHSLGVLAIVAPAGLDPNALASPDFRARETEGVGVELPGAFRH